MDPTGPFARRFPLVARPRPACAPLTRRVEELCDRAHKAERDQDLAAASAVHNLAALLASDCGLPDLARQWCRRQANIHLRGHPLDTQAARLALEPMINLARLQIRDGQGERAFDLIDTLYIAVSTRADTTIDGVEIPAHLTNSPHAHQEVRRWLWAVLLATGARALAVAGRWQEAHTRLRDYKGIGHRMLDGRQVAIIAHATSEDTAGARALLRNTEPGEPWENAVTSCLTIQCRSATDNTNLEPLLDHYRALNTWAPGLTVFHTRLGLSFVDAIGSVNNPSAARIAADLINRAIALQDGYVAHDILSHCGCREFLTESQTRHLQSVVKSCALDHGTIPAALLDDLTTALSSVEDILQRNTV